MVNSSLFQATPSAADDNDEVMITRARHLSAETPATV